MHFLYAVYFRGIPGGKYGIVVLLKRVARRKRPNDIFREITNKEI